MTRPILSAIACICCCTVAHAGKKELKPDSGGIILQPGEGEIAAGEELTITFPTAMVSADKIDLAGQPSPLLTEPKLEGDFLWKSQTEGVLTVKSVVAGASHRFTLAPGLRDLAGKRIAPADWGAEFKAPEFSVTSDFEKSEYLSVRPQIPLTSTYDVRLAEVAEHVYFQDRDSQQRFAVEVLLEGEREVSGEVEAKEFRVAPRDALPPDRTFDLIVNGLLDAKSRKPLPYLKVFPVGKTQSLAVEWVGAFNSAIEEPTIRIKFADSINPAEASREKLAVEPAVPEMKLRATGDEVVIKGRFDLAQHYQITISTALKGERGYGLREQSRWGATFHAKPPTIVFPASQIFLRARQELRFSFFQINTAAVTWKIARIPLEKLPLVSARVREFERNETDPVTGKNVIDLRTGFKKQFQTELLIDGLALPVVASGRTEATSGDASVRRDVRFNAAKESALGGAYLMEASAALPDGRVVGNRSIVCLSDLILTQKRTPDTVVLRVAKMSDAQLVPEARVRAVTDENIQLGQATTDKNGIATFDRRQLFPAKAPGAHLFVAETAEGIALQFADNTTFYGSGSDAPTSHSRRAEIITDRNLYRPGQMVKIKGMARNVLKSTLSLPEKSDVHWRVTDNGGEHVVGEGTATLSGYGGWEAEWNVPEKSKLGEFRISCQIGHEQYDGSALFRVEEYRAPIFSVQVEAAPEIGAAAHARVGSAYFHGAPNAGARVRWKATWTASIEAGDETNQLKRYNAFARVGPALDIDQPPTKTIEGDTKLDEHGFAALTCESPFKDNLAISKATVFWRADVTSVDGQTITGGAMAPVFATAVRLGVQASEQSGEGIKVRVDAINTENAQVTGIRARVDLFHVTTKTAKERIAPFVFRYRNTDEFSKVASQEVTTAAEFVFPAKETGRYVAAASESQSKAPLVSDETVLSGEETAELPVENETSFKVEHETRAFVPGEKAVLSTQAPFGGVAWVSVETDQILDTLLLPVAGNAGRIELPIKKEYAPNATVSIYLVKPGGEKQLPRERFATSEIEVGRPERALEIKAHIVSSSVRPAEKVQGEVRVNCEGRPVADADLVVFAVDEAVLKLGEWKLPEVLTDFYPRNPFAVSTYQALERYIESILPKSLTEKGFVIGDGGEGEPAKPQNVRKEFQTLAFWQGSLITDHDGKAAFEFTAPDNLTTYRLVALGQTKTHQFGGDASATVQISKPLLINAALPRFLRNGDEIELRAIAQQNFADSEEVTMRCVTDGNCKLMAEPLAKQMAARDAPLVFRFKARVQDAELAPAKIRFEAVAKSDPKMSDALELTLPVMPPTIVRKEAVAGSFSGPRFDAQAQMSEVWKRGRGNFDATISTSPWLPKMTGIPLILDYPHGCFDQISTKLLAYSLLANLLAYLPDVETREAEYRRVLERGMNQFNDSLLSDGMLPYWPGGDNPNPFVTCEAFWAVNEAIKAGFDAPEGLRDKLARAMKKTAQGDSGSFQKCFALFVLSQYEQDQELASVAQDLYLRRNHAGDEERALLAIVLHRLNILSREQEQLLKEIAAPPKERAFDPATLASMARAEAMIAFAFQTIAPKNWTGLEKQRVRERMLALMDSSAALSTQENLWLLLAFKSMVEAENVRPLTNPNPPGVLSKNGCSAAWLDRKIQDPFGVNGLQGATLTFLMKAEYSTDEVETDRVDRGFRVERVVKDLTDNERTGAVDAPFKIGDQLLISYRINTRKKQNYVALEDSLPAGLETVNPDLAMVGRFFALPPVGSDSRLLPLSHSELRDRATLLYFDDFDPGTGTYSVLARATAAGAFRWPATQVTPMYDSRFSGLSPSSVCVISGE
jgi:alpha-2-macroglobulin